MEYVIFFSRYIFVVAIVGFLISNLILLEWGKNLSIISYGFLLIMHVLSFFILADRIEIIKSISLGLASAIIFMVVLKKLKRILPNTALVIFNCVSFLLDVGLIILSRIEFGLAVRQFLWIIAGISLTFFLPIFFKFTSRFKWAANFYILAGIFLLGMNFLYSRQINGAMNWLSISGLKFQPSEVLKLIYIFYLGYALGKSHRNFFMPTIFSSAIILFLVLQKDLGAALIFFVLYAGQIYFASGNKKIFLGALFLIILGFFIGYFVFPHVRARIISWINPWNNIKNEGYQIAQSLFAICSGNLFGSGLTLGFVKYIPVAQSDFIFAAICEEFGNIFSIGIILIFTLIIFAICRILSVCNDNFFAAILNGIMILTGWQSFLIIGGCIKLIPLTGVTLPFVSYGGTSLIVNILLLASAIYILVKNYEQIISA